MDEHIDALQAHLKQSIQPALDAAMAGATIQAGQAVTALDGAVGAMEQQAAPAVEQATTAPMQAETDQLSAVAGDVLETIASQFVIPPEVADGLLEILNAKFTFPLEEVDAMIRATTVQVAGATEAIMVGMNALFEDVDSQLADVSADLLQGSSSPAAFANAMVAGLDNFFAQWDAVFADVTGARELQITQAGVTADAVAAVAAGLTEQMNAGLMVMLSTLSEVSKTIDRQIAEAFNAVFAPGNWLVDLHLAMSPRSSEAERQAARERTAQRLCAAWRLYHPALRPRLYERARDWQLPFEAAKRQVMLAATILALGESNTPQRIRLGRNQWVKDRDGKAIEIIPLSLSIERFWRWLLSRASKIANEDLIPEFGLHPRPAYAEKPEQLLYLEQADATVVDAATICEKADPLQMVTEVENWQEDTGLLKEIECRASPRTCELLERLKDEDTIAAAARCMGIAESTARVILARLRRSLS
jgi:hypothetical protein